MTSTVQDAYQALREALATVRLAALNIYSQTGVNVLPQLDLEFDDTPADPSDEVPNYDVNGVSQLMGPEKLVMLKLVEDLRARVAEVDEKQAALIPKLFACVPGRNKLLAYSDDWLMIDMEISNAAFMNFGNPAEALNVNKYERREGALPFQRLIKLYQQYVPGAMALPSELTTAKACAARVAEYTRAKMENARVANVYDIDFSPAKPKK